MELTPEYLRDVLRYDPETGVFVWAKGRRAGKKAGWYKPSGYELICLGGELHRSHRLAWLYIHGVWPPEQIDHINGDPRDNRLCNLREATVRQNRFNLGRYKNNRSGLKGVHWHSQSQMWRSQIRADGVIKSLGLFPTKEAAYAAYLAASQAIHGEFSRAA